MGRWNFPRVFLVAINVVFMTIGLALIIVGAMFKGRWHVIRDAFTSIEGESFTLTYAGDTLALAIILWGVFVFFLAFVGFIGALCKIRIVLSVYALIVSILFVAEGIILGTVLAKGSKAQSALELTLRESFNDYSENNSDHRSRAIAALFSTLKCCGVRGDTDFYGDKIIRWEPDLQNRKAAELLSLPNEQEDSDEHGEKDNMTQSVITTLPPPTTTTRRAYHMAHKSMHPRAAGLPVYRPITCCPDVDYEHLSPEVYFKQQECLNSKNSTTAFRGCYDKIWEIIDEYRGAIIGVGVTILFLEIFVVVLACMLCCRDNTDDFYKRASI